VRLQATEVNGQPGVVAIDAQNRVVGVMALGIADGRIQTIHSVANPDKLHHLDRHDDSAALLRTDLG
jgi:RNA polymerase sigma-70 factor (ECF subfamily)